VARVPKIVGVKVRGDSWGVREFRVHLQPFAKETDWRGRNGTIRTAAARKSRSHRRSAQRLQTVFAEFDRLYGS
jgi:hypothetical protein